MDTDLTPDSGPTTASRQTFVTGNAALLAARQIRQHIFTALEVAWDVEEEQIQLTPEGARLQPVKSEKNELNKSVLREITWQQIAELLEHTVHNRSFRQYYVAPKTWNIGEGNPIHFAFPSVLKRFKSKCA